ncbi:MAG: rRNA maturation RNase YbeY [Planctomycetota bacterium]
MGDDAPSDAQLERALLRALDHGGAPDRRVDVIVVDDPTLTDLHGRFLGDPTPTDVVTFDLGGDDEAARPTEGGPVEDGPDGELYVSLDMARRVALERGVPLARELTLYVVHGALHLCGYDDIDDAERAAMRAAEAVVMDALGFAPDDAPHDRDE